MALAGITSLRVTRGVLLVAALGILVLVSSMYFLAGGDVPDLPARAAPPTPHPLRTPSIQQRHINGSSHALLQVLCSMGGEYSSWCGDALQSSMPKRIVSGAASVEELVLVVDCLASSSACEERPALTVLIAEDPRNVAADCIALGEHEREECLRMMHAHAKAFARLFELGGRNNILRVTEGGEEQVFRDRHWFVCAPDEPVNGTAPVSDTVPANGTVGTRDAASNAPMRCVLVLDYIDLSERPDVSSVALQLFLQASPMSSNSLQLVSPPPRDPVFSSSGQYGRFWDALTLEECDLVPATNAQSEWMAAHGYYRRDQRTVVSSLFYYTEKKGSTAKQKRKELKALSKRMLQARAFVSSMLPYTSRLEVLMVVFVLQNGEAKPLPETLMDTLDWIGAQEGVTLEVRRAWPEWFNQNRSHHLLKGAVLTHALMIEADVAVYHDLDTMMIDIAEVSYYSPRHLRMNVADQVSMNTRVAGEWMLHDIAEPQPVHHTVTIDGDTAPYFWHNGGLMVAPGYIMGVMGWEIIERGNALSPKLASRDMFAISFAYHKLLPPFSPLPVQLNFNVNKWIRDICKLVHAPIVSVHYHSLPVSDGAPNLIKQPKKKCTTYNEMLEKFERLRQRFSET